MTQGGERRGAGHEVSGEALLAAHSLWIEGRGGPSADAVAESLGLSSDAFRDIVAFHHRIVTRPPDEPLVLCRGVSCRLHGADALHAALRSRLEASGVLGRIVEVHCLSQCQHGPNLKLDNRVLCLGAGCVITDDRPWRPESAGPKPLQAPAPPAQS